MNDVIGHLQAARRILLTTHSNPDGDAIGALVALGLTLERLNKETLWINESPIPAVYRFLPGAVRIQTDLPANAAFDTAVVLDCGDLQRLGGIASRVAAIPVVINIDHHVTNTGFGTCHLIDADACATCEIVYRLIRRLDLAIDRDVATSIYTGIFTDTGSFRFSNTNLAAFAICQEMVSLGVDPYNVAKHVYGTYSLGRIKLLNLALDSLELAAEGKVSIMTLSQDMFEETRTQPEDGDGLINYARRIEDVKIAALIQEQPNGNAPDRRYHVSLRSDGSVDVAAIAAGYGGGGHATAAGFNIRGPLAAIKADLIDLAHKL